MSDLTGQSSSPQPEQPITATLANDGWWPDVDMLELREALRLPGDVTDKRLVNTTRSALRRINNALASWKQQRKAAGCLDLSQVPTTTDDDLKDGNVLTGHYLDAVYSQVDAQLCKQYRNTDTTASGDKRADMIDPREAEALRDTHLAIKAILEYDVPARLSISVELI